MPPASPTAGFVAAHQSQVDAAAPEYRPRLKLPSKKAEWNAYCFDTIHCKVAILRNRWLSFMIQNGYINLSGQKAFMPFTPSCIEHNTKLAAVLLSQARRKHKSLTACWLDIANAYRSVHHSLIQFSLQHYHAPPEFCKISIYTYLSASISTNHWSTGIVPLEIGVYQGYPLSVAIFNTVINTLHSQKFEGLVCKWNLLICN